MELPSYAQGPPPQGLGLALTMSHFMPTNYRELTLLYIHRCFFAHAISSNPLDPIKSQYAPSFLAGYRSACTIIGSVKQQFSMFPAQIARFWVLWTHAFSATVMLASVVTHSSKCKVAPAALLELNSSCELFASAANYGGRAVKFLPILRRLQSKAQQVYRETTSGIAPKIQNDIFRPSEPEDNKDELSIFSGKTHTVATKSANVVSSSSTPLRSSTSRSSAQSGDAADSSRASSDSPKQAFTDNPSFANVHPSLVNELNVFDGHIRAQLQNAQRADLFGGSSMAVDRGPGPSLQQQRHQQELARQEQIRIQQRQERQKFQQQQERERQEVERQQQILMQQQAQQQAHLHQQQQQQEEELRRREQQQQQQRQEQYRLQVEEQQRHLQQQQLQQQHQQHYGHHYRSSERAAYPQPSGPDHPMHDIPPPPAIPSSVASAHHLRQLSHSQSHPNLQLAYQQQQHQQHYQPMPHAIPSRHPAEPSPPPQQQHQMYAVPPGEFAHHQPSPESSCASPAQYTPPATSTYDSRSRASQSQAAPYRRESYQYWPGAPNGYAIEEQQPHGVGPSQQQPVYQPHQHYTPGGVLRGIAAEDSSLQETWQSYMHKVASPRHLFED
ncbi:hypothetical protein K443DRAFT_2598 [Laccaria amethystina LaAM-08-1]|nr:hypothetical protein K443DRAFT_2598 [Laccaria amethystina LaAM-08-1]